MRIILLNLKQALRNMRRNGWQTLFSLLGLVMGVVCLSYSLNWLWNETHHDSFRPAYRDTYMVHTYIYADSTFAPEEEPLVYVQSVSWPSMQQAAGLLPEGSLCSAIIDLEDVSLTDGDGGMLQPASFWAVEPSFARLAGLKSIAGDAEKALSQPGQMVVSRKEAVKFFGSVEKAMGATVRTHSDIFLDGDHVFNIAAVTEDAPGPCNLKADVLIGDFGAHIPEDETQWGCFNYQMVVQTPHREQAAASLMWETMGGRKGRSSLRLIPLRLSHLDCANGNYLSQLIYPLAFVGMAVLLLLSAFFNYIALLTTLFLGRLRQYALRVSMGAGFGQCTLWLYTEVLVMVLLCGACTAVALEWINQLADIPEASHGVYRMLALVLAAFVVLMLAGALFPVLRMRRLYRSRLGMGLRHMGVSRSLLLVQVGACCLMLFVMATGYRQMHNIFTADLGFRTADILRIKTNQESLYNSFFDIEQQLNDGSSPAIVRALGLNRDIFENESSRWMGAKALGITEEPYNKEMVCTFTLPWAAFDFFGMQMDEGTWFRLPLNQAVETPCILNPEAVERLHLQDYSTRRLAYRQKPMPVLGVLSFRTHSLHTGQDPTVIFCTTDAQSEGSGQPDRTCIYVKHRPGMEGEAREAIRHTLEAHGVAPETVPVERFTDYVNRNYDKERNYLRVFSAIAASSVVITLMGVLSMILYTLRLQRRGIAIRRVFGATYATLCRHYLRGYVIVTLVAAVVALPVGWHLSARWLEGYDVRIAIGWVQPVVIVCVLLGVIAAIVALQVWRAMREQPARVIQET